MKTLDKKIKEAALKYEISVDGDCLNARTVPGAKVGVCIVFVGVQLTMRLPQEPTSLWQN